MNLKDFENEYWRQHDQSPVFRHKAALCLIEKGPILDLGCGDGFFLAKLQEKKISGVGLDRSVEAISQLPELQRSKTVEEIKKSHREIEKHSRPQTN